MRLLRTGRVFKFLSLRFLAKKRRFLILRFLIHRHMSCYLHDNKRQNSNRRPSMQFQPVFPEMHVRKNPPKRFTAPCENYHKAKLLPILPYPTSKNLLRKPRNLLPPFRQYCRCFSLAVRLLFLPNVSMLYRHSF